MNRKTNQALLESNLKKLPEACYSAHPENKRKVVLLKRGETGYWPAHDGEFPNESDAERFVNDYNAKLEVSPAQREAMRLGSIFGWDLPAADPDNEIVKKSSVFAEAAAQPAPRQRGG